MDRQAKAQTNIVGGMSNFIPVSDGAFRVGVNEVVAEVYGLDFTAADDYIDIAAIIEAKLLTLGSPASGLTVVPSAAAGDDVTFLFSSEVDGGGLSSYVSILFPPAASESGTDVSGKLFLNGNDALLFVMNSIYLVDGADMTSIAQNNASHADTLSIMNFYDLDTQQGSGKCIEKCVVEMPQYSDWYNDLNAIEPFSSRTVVVVKIDNG